MKTIWISDSDDNDSDFESKPPPSILQPHKLPRKTPRITYSSFKSNTTTTTTITRKPIHIQSKSKQDTSLNHTTIKKSLINSTPTKILPPSYESFSRRNSENLIIPETPLTACQNEFAKFLTRTSSELSEISTATSNASTNTNIDINTTIIPNSSTRYNTQEDTKLIAQKFSSRKQADSKKIKNLPKTSRRKINIIDHDTVTTPYDLIDLSQENTHHTPATLTSTSKKKTTSGLSLKRTSKEKSHNNSRKTNTSLELQQEDHRDISSSIQSKSIHEKDSKSSPQPLPVSHQEPSPSNVKKNSSLKKKNKKSALLISILDADVDDHHDDNDSEKDNFGIVANKGKNKEKEKDKDKVIIIDEEINKEINEEEKDEEEDGNRKGNKSIPVKRKKRVFIAPPALSSNLMLPKLLTLEEDDAPNLNPRRECPWCLVALPDPLPSHLITPFENLKDIAVDVDMTDPSNLSYSKRKALYQFCRLHKIYSIDIPAGIAKQYPQLTFSDFESLPKRIRLLSGKLRQLVLHGQKSYYFKLHLETCQSLGKRQSKIRGPGLSQALACRPGYYGPYGGNIIMKELLNLFSRGEDAILDATSASPFSIIEYVQMILVPEAASRLIKEDLSCSLAKAREIMKESGDFGSALWDLESEDEGDEEEEEEVDDENEEEEEEEYHNDGNEKEEEKVDVAEMENEIELIRI